MKTRIISSLKDIMQDRTLFLLLLAVAAAGVVYSIFALILLEPSELQVAARYTAFGETKFYRNTWFYLTSFAVFGIIFTLGHAGLMIKLLRAGLRPLAMAFGWLSLIIIFIAALLTFAVLTTAF